MVNKMVNTNFLILNIKQHTVFKINNKRIYRAVKMKKRIWKIKHKINPRINTNSFKKSYLHIIKHLINFVIKLNPLFIWLEKNRNGSQNDLKMSFKDSRTHTYDKTSNIYLNGVPNPELNHRNYTKKKRK